MFEAETFVFLVPIVGTVAFFSYLAVASFTADRRRERETYYRHELYRKAVELHGTDALDRVSELHREDELNARIRRRDSARAGGLALAGLGIGMMIGMRWIGESLYMLGAIPLSVGIGLLVLSFTVDPTRQPAPPKR